MLNNDTIVGIATGNAQGSGVSILRLSGDKSIEIIKAVFRGNTALKSHTVSYGHIMSGGQIIDEVLVTIMRAPKSYTKEDVAEINCHGGAACVKAVLELLLENGARLAEPGEFTKRAFLNGRIDLSQAEAVMDLIDARTELSRRAAVTRLQGKLHTAVESLRERVLTLIAHIEASIDYPEHDMEQLNLQEISEKSAVLSAEIERLILNGNRSKILKEGIETVIVGRPNVGKSSLMNALLNEERAIVTDIAGTTRDALFDYIDIAGIPLKIVDTAGLRDTNDVIERVGVEKTRQYMETAQLVLFVIDGSQPVTDDEREIYAELTGKKAEMPTAKKVLVLVNKSDLPRRAELDFIDGAQVIEISALNNHGIDDLCVAIRDLFLGKDFEMDEILISGLRQQTALQNAAAALAAVRETIDMGLTEDLVSVDLQNCYEYLGEIIGQSLDDDIIDKIFSQFCLGK